MSLERAFRHLSLRPVTLCKQCRRAFTSPSFKQQNAPQSTAKALSDSLESSRTPSTSRAPAQYGSRSAPASLQNVTAPSQSPDLAAFFEASVREAAAPAVSRRQQEQAADSIRGASRQELEKQMTRKFKVGDVYAPHDLTGVEMSKWKKLRRKGRPKRDVIDQLGINPKDHYKNFSIMSEYMSDMGRIKHSRETGLRPRNQRRMAKAIRRAIGIGLMPGVHRHPEILRRELESKRLMI